MGTCAQHGHRVRLQHPDCGEQITPNLTMSVVLRRGSPEGINTGLTNEIRFASVSWPRSFAAPAPIERVKTLKAAALVRAGRSAQHRPL
jgi:hypothetical protein